VEKNYELEGNKVKINISDGVREIWTLEEDGSITKGEFRLVTQEMKDAEKVAAEAKRKRLAQEKKAERKRLAEAKETEQKRLAEAKEAERKRLAAAKAKQTSFKQQAEARALAQKAADEKNKADGVKFLTENGKKKGVTTTKSGLQYEVLKQGVGAKPKATDKVTVNYRGTLIDGTEFDSSYKRGQPVTFPLNGVIKGWTEGVQLMNVGSKYKFVLPSKLAYGARGTGPKIGPNSVLVFDVELINIGGAKASTK